MQTQLSILFNIVWFQACWFACVLIGNRAALVVLAVMICAYVLVQNLRAEWPLVLGIGLLGLVVDTGLINSGVLNKPNDGYLPPLWLSVLWLAFATTINHSLRPLMNKRMLFLLLAFIAGPVCYQLGVTLTDMQFGYPSVISLPLLAIIWLLAGFIILLLYNRWRICGSEKI